ncbi:DUF1295 domain-containing protein [Nocardioides nanhaiensis]|uniref:DUF1295 domain-containing protein n=1 Tax=Nocardioides nanhaiensis TaxID=1476871 RepID=A0ABP8WNU6_9ACTN
MDEQTSTRPALSRSASLTRVAVAYVLAIGAGAAWLLAGPDTGRLWLDALIADVVATLVVFAASRLHRNSSFYDAYWSVVPPLLALYWWLAADAGTDPVRWWLVMGLILVWAVRLTANWLRGWPGLHHEDWRYPLLRERAGRAELLADLGGIHLVPTLQVFLGTLPVYVVVTRGQQPVGWLDVVALLVGLGAVALETVADLQMHRFVRTRRPGQVMTQGLWAWSRHPNYVGELGFWFSLALFGLAADPGAWWVLVGTAAMLAMFLGASIPMMEERSVQRRPEYAQAVAGISRFLPRPPRAPRTGVSGQPG